MFNGDFLRKNKIKYQEDLSSSSDYELWLRLAHNYEDCKFYNLPVILGLYRIHETNITQTKLEKWQNTNAELKRPYLKNLCKSLTEDEFETHKAIYDQKYANNQEELLKIKNWLIKMRTANDAKKIYDSKLFPYWAAHKFMEICFASLHLGPWAVKQLITYPDYAVLDLPDTQMNQLLSAASSYAKEYRIKSNS